MGGDRGTVPQKFWWGDGGANIPQYFMKGVLIYHTFTTALLFVFASVPGDDLFFALLEEKLI
jgi:hypothetical protein